MSKVALILKPHKKNEPPAPQALSRDGGQTAQRTDEGPAKREGEQAKEDSMGFNCGIVGLPNVGKSTLFNALTATQAAEAANYPFCTIEPNVGRVAVPDERLDVCARLAKSAKIVPTQLEFVDIAGLVRGASKGEGLGNQFLGHIREVDAIAHVLRCFEDGNVTHVEGSIDPVARRRDGRDRADARRSRQPREARHRRGRRKRARGRQGSEGAARRRWSRRSQLLRDGKPARALARRRRAEADLHSDCSCSPPSRCSMSANVEEARRRHRQRAIARASPTTPRRAAPAAW